jgi:hypothetical protein
VLFAVACADERDSAGTIAGARRPPEAIATRVAADQQAAARFAPEPPDATQIVFGDLHVHTTYSVDAFVFSLPLMGGEGAHPPADACDFARYCAAIDFFAITDHAEGLTPSHWQRTKESLRECNARAGDPANPDVVGFVGWEWTQVGATPATHYGHRNVIFPGLDDNELPSRPITALADEVFGQTPNAWLLRGLRLLTSAVSPAYGDFFELVGQLAELPNCPAGIDTRALPPTCRENAPTPRELFEKLAQWGFDALVIPHGLAWGEHAPPGARMDNQLAAAQHDAARQRLLEVFSGHGNSEEYRRWRSEDDGDSPACPLPTRDFLPCCWRAGEIMRARCGDLPAAECERRVEEAKALALSAGVAPHLVFPDTQESDWLDCDQCRHCFKPAYAMRPGETAQYSLAISNFEAPQPHRFRWGFIASSDDHKAQPGTGYKQRGRRAITDAHGFASERVERGVRRAVGHRSADPRRPQPARYNARSFAALLDVERGASFMYPGGLAAAHTTARSRTAIWDALKRREVYGTSGPRILLWFDLLNGPHGRVPMGATAAVTATPRFEVRAVGAFVQQSGCPAESVHGLPADRLARLCHGECYHPSDQRHPITAIEVVRIRPQRSPNEPVDDLIEDPWRRFDCPPDPNGCAVTFVDDDFPASGRDAVYYVRALQAATPAINAANYRTEFDAAGNPIRIRPCSGSYRTPADDDCLAPVQERAWSSPIFVDQASE